MARYYVGEDNIRDYVFIIINVFFNIISKSLIQAIMQDYAKTFNLGMKINGIAQGIDGLLTGVAIFIAGYWKKKIGNKMLLNIFLLGTVLTQALQFWCSKVWMFIVCRGATGLFTGAMTMYSTMMVDLSKKKDLNTRFGVLWGTYSLAYCVGMLFSDPLTKIVGGKNANNRESLKSYWFVSSGISLLCVFLAEFTLKNTKARNRVKNICSEISETNLNLKKTCKFENETNIILLLIAKFFLHTMNSWAAYNYFYLTNQTLSWERNYSSISVGINCGANVFIQMFGLKILFRYFDANTILTLMTAISFFSIFIYAKTTNIILHVLFTWFSFASFDIAAIIIAQTLVEETPKREEYGVSWADASKYFSRFLTSSAGGFMMDLSVSYTLKKTCLNKGYLLYFTASFSGVFACLCCAKYQFRRLREHYIIQKTKF